MGHACIRYIHTYIHTHTMVIHITGGTVHNHTHTYITHTYIHTYIQFGSIWIRFGIHDIHTGTVDIYKVRLFYITWGGLVHNHPHTYIYGDIGYRYRLLCPYIADTYSTMYIHTYISSYSTYMVHLRVHLYDTIWILTLHTMGQLHFASLGYYYYWGGLHT